MFCLIEINVNIKTKDEKRFEFGLKVATEFDDARNTDNSWLETKVINFHDDDGSITKNLQLVWLIFIHVFNLIKPFFLIYFYSIIVQHISPFHYHISW